MAAEVCYADDVSGKRLLFDVCSCWLPRVRAIDVCLAREGGAGGGVPAGIQYLSTLCGLVLSTKNEYRNVHVFTTLFT